MAIYKTHIILHEISISHLRKISDKYLLWNRGVWCSFHNTYQTFLAPCIRCTNHLCDFCLLADVNPHITTPEGRYNFKINSYWPIVTSSIHEPVASYCDATMIPWFLWTLSYHNGADVSVLRKLWNKHVSVMQSFSSFIIDRICWAVNNGFDHLAAARQHENYALFGH